MRISLRLYIAIHLIILSFSFTKAQDYHWVRSLGSFSVDEGVSVARDNSGNSYTLGRFNDTVDFDPGPGSFNLVSTCQITGDMYVTKFDFLGNLIWAVRVGGSGLIFPKSITIDGSKSTYVTGQFNGGIDFDPGPALSSYSTTSSSYCFILKLDSMGNYKWCQTMGAFGSSCMGNSIIMGNNGDFLIAGDFFTDNGQPVDFDPGSGVITMTSSGQANPFISKFDTSGNFLWVKGYLAPANCAAGGSAVSITTSNMGNIFVSGYFKNSFSYFVDFDPGPGTYSLSNNDSYDIFISKLDGNGNFIWANGLKGPLSDFARRINVDNLENVYTLGYFKDTVDFDPGPGTYTIASGGNNDGFISKLDASGNFVWAKTLNGPGQDYCNSMGFDTNNNLIITGSFNSGCDLDPGPGTNILNCTGQYDSYILSLDQTGNTNWVKQLKSLTANGGCAANSISIDGNNMYLTGSYAESVDFNPDSGVGLHTSVNSSADAFILKLGTCNFPLDVSSSATICTGMCATLTANGAFNYTWSTTSNSAQIVVCPSTSFVYTVMGDVSATCTQSNTINVTVSSCTGLKENELKENFVSVFPNPAATFMFLASIEASEKLNVRIGDINGKLLFERDLQTENFVTNIDLSLKNGIYFVTITNAKKERNIKKLVIAK